MSEGLRATGAPLVYMVAAVAFFLSLKAIQRVKLAARGRALLVAAIALAMAGAVFEVGAGPVAPIMGAFVAGGVLGAFAAGRVGLAAPPARYAWIPALAGLAVFLSAIATLARADLGVAQRFGVMLASTLAPAAALLGLAVALRGEASTRATASAAMVVALAGWSAAMLGLGQSNLMLLVGGGVLGTAGVALGRIVAAAAGRSLSQALFGKETPDPFGYTSVRACGTEELAAALESASTVLVVPGFGMAAAGAQHVVKELAELLERRGARVVFAVHPAAGAVPGHMNIALDEAGVPHDRLLEADAARASLTSEADAVLVLGANDVVNADASRDAASPLFGLEALDLTASRNVFVVKRSLRPGAGGVKNPLLDRPNTLMIFGDAKRAMQSLMVELKGGGH